MTSRDLENNIFLKSLARLLRPILRYCLRHNIKHSDLANVLRQELVSLAMEELQASGEKWNVSRLSVMTGLHRREIDRLAINKDHLPRRTHLLNRLVGLWQSDERFSFKNGKPRPLAEQGEGASFRDLIDQVSRELNPATVLFELERSGLVKRENGKVTLKSEAFIPQGDAEQVLQLVSTDVNTLISAAEDNLSGDPKRSHLHLTTHFDNVDPKDVSVVKGWIINQGFQFHDKVRKYLARFDRDSKPGAKFQPKSKRISGKQGRVREDQGGEGLGYEDKQQEGRHTFSITTFSFDAEFNKLSRDGKEEHE